MTFTGPIKGKHRRRFRVFHHMGQRVGWHGCGASTLRHRAVLAFCVVLIILVPATSVRADAQATDGQNAKPVTPPSKLPLGEPVVKADAKFFGQRVTAWRSGTTHFALLEREVTIDVGSYGFTADKASLRIDVENTQGRRVRHLSIYMTNARGRRGTGPISADGSRLFVTVSTTGKVKIASDKWTDGSAADDPLVRDGDERLRRHLAGISKPVIRMPLDKDGNPILVGPDGKTRPIEVPNLPQIADPRNVQLPPVTRRSPGSGLTGGDIVPKDGVVAFSADKIVFDKTDDQSTLTLVGKVRLMYQALGGESGLSLQADNAVIFMGKVERNALIGNRAKSADVRGIYLEDNVVATDGDYTLRAPRVYYDTVQNKAVVLDAVLYAWDIRRQIPLYVRALKIRQESRKQWSAEGAVLTTSEFAEPHVAIRADRITFRQERATDGSVRNWYDAKDLSITVGDLPVAYLPSLAGQGQEVPLRRASARYSSDVGAEVLTKWDLFALLGRQPTEGTDLTADIDVRGDHGVGLGLSLDYDRPEMWGYLQGYAILNDHGEDDIADGREISHDGDFRGFVKGYHRHYLDDGWELALELGFSSDETFLEEFFKSEANASKPYETGVYLKKVFDQDSAFTLLGTYDLNDFTPQNSTLQAPGYIVDKLPEAAWRQIGESLFGDRLTYFGDTRVSRMRIQLGEDSPADRGFSTAASTAVFGIMPAGTPFDLAGATAGVPTDHRYRIDTRHELNAPIKLGIVNATPYVSGRVTAYDQDFDTFAGEDDQIRYFGTVGARFHTQVNRIYENVENDLFDLHRLRHVIEPKVDVFFAASSVNPEDIPIFDADVESLHEGFGARIGMRQTFQTQRGGEGRWRSVDWMVLDTDLVLRSDDADTNTEIARYYSYRPEYTVGGDHFYTRLMWNLSESLAVVAETTYSLENDRMAQWRIGSTYKQTPRLTWYTDYSRIDVIESDLLSFGFTYQMTTKWQVAYNQTLDVNRGESRDMQVSLIRQLPRWRLMFLVAFDDIEDEQVVGIILIPDGVRTSRGAEAFRGYR